MNSNRTVVPYPLLGPVWSDWVMALVVFYGVIPWVVAWGLRPWVQWPLVWLAVSSCITLGVLWVLSCWVVRPSLLWGQFSEATRSLAQQLKAGLVATVGMVALGLMWTALMATVQGHWPSASAPPWTLGGLAGVLTLWTVGIASPLIEELLFRGWGQSTVRQIVPSRLPYWGQVGLSIVLPTVVFAALHSQYWHNAHALGATFLLGLWLGWMRHTTGSVLPGMAAHLIYNSVGLILMGGGFA